MLVILQQKGNVGEGRRYEGIQALHSDKPHEYKFQPGGPEEGWRAAVPGGSPGAGGPQGRGLGHKTKHGLPVPAEPQSSHRETRTASASKP